MPEKKGSKKPEFEIRDLLPNSDTHDQAAELESYHRRLCEYVGKQQGIDFFKLYNKYPESEIIRLLGIQNANSYTGE